MKVARALAIATAAAIVATVGDLLLLWMGNAQRVDMELAQPPGIALTIGGILGCVGILLYAIGYLAVARTVRPHRPTSATVIAVAGTAFALIGASTHGLTWLAIRTSVAAGVASAPPIEAVAGSTGLLLDAWVADAVLMLVVALTIARTGLALPRALPVWLAMLNPVNVTLVLMAAGAATELGRAFVVPAAPNLAHVVFFGAALYASAALADRNAPDGADRTR